MEKPRWTANNNPSSMATISAQPMSRPPLFQPERSFHASHSCPNMTPMPQVEEASTQKLTGDVGGGFDNREPQKSRDKRLRHQEMSERTLGLGNRRMKGEEEPLKEETNRGPTQLLSWKTFGRWSMIEASKDSGIF